METQLGDHEFDLIIMIYTDFGVLNPTERAALLKNVRKALKPKGYFIFDVLNEKSLDKAVLEKTWECADKGFWSDTPYLHLSNSHLYKEEKVIVYQHFIADDDNELRTYYFWTHFFSDEDIITTMKNCNFKVLALNKDVLPESDQWNGKNVTFIASQAN